MKIKDELTIKDAMKTLLNISVLILTVVMLQACPTSPGDSSQIVEPVLQVDSVSVIGLQNRTITLNAYATVPDPCHSYSHMTFDINGRDITINLFSKRDKEAICITVLGEITVEQLQIPVDAGGEYRLHFTGKADTLEIQLSVP